MCKISDGAAAAGAAAGAGAGAQTRGNICFGLVS